MEESNILISQIYPFNILLDDLKSMTEIAIKYWFYQLMLGYVIFFVRSMNIVKVLFNGYWLV